MKYKLTVATTTYNQEKYIGECLDGIVNQKTNFPFQVIVSDDGSTDNTRKILKEYNKKYPDIVRPIFREKNLGPMDNFIETLNGIDTEYVALCDGDDFWTDYDKLQKQVDFLDNNKDYTICFHQTKIFFQDGSRKEELTPQSNAVEDTTEFSDLAKECYIPANTVMYRWQFSKKDSFKKKFPTNVVPGDYFVHLLHARSGKIKFMKEVMSCYRRHEAGMWWLSSQPDKQEEFHLKYGVKYLNFFKAVEKEFGLSNDFYINQKRYLVYQIARAYLNHHMWEELAILEKENKDLVQDYFKTINFDQLYYSLSKPKKMLYLLLFDRSILNQKIKDRLEKRPKLFKIYKMITKYKKIFLYLIFGVLTTLINIITYLLLTRTFSVNIYLSNAIAWIISVLFAFVTNKTLVFESKDKSGKTVTREIISFFACRIMSLGIDMASMYAMVTILKWNDFVGKIIANVIVIILNYVFSKLLVFRKKK